MRNIRTDDPTSLLLIGQVAERLACSTHTIRRWCKANAFPQPIFLTNSSHARWRLRDVEAFIAKRSVSRRPRPELKGAAAAPASKKGGR